MRRITQTNPESVENMDFPVHGLSLIREFEAQPPGTTVTGTNVRVVEALTLRGRGGTRHGLSRYIDEHVFAPFEDRASKIQHLNIIVDPTTEALLANDDNGDSDPTNYIFDPSTNNLKRRKPISPLRRVRRGGSGKQLNAKLPASKVTVTADDQTKPSGDEFTFTGNEFTATPMLPGDSISSATLWSGGSIATAPDGDYPINIAKAVINSPEGRKYKVTYVKGTMTVGGDPLVQLEGGNDTASFDNPVTAGNLIILWIEAHRDQQTGNPGNNTVPSFSPTDNLGSVYTLVGSAQTYAGPYAVGATTYDTAGSAAMYWAVAASSGACTIDSGTDCPTAGGAGTGLLIFEFACTNPAPFDDFAVNTNFVSQVPPAPTNAPFTIGGGGVPVSGSGELVVVGFWVSFFASDVPPHTPPNFINTLGIDVSYAHGVSGPSIDFSGVSDNSPYVQLSGAGGPSDAVFYGYFVVGASFKLTL